MRFIKIGALIFLSTLTLLAFGHTDTEPVSNSDLRQPERSKFLLEHLDQAWKVELVQKEQNFFLLKTQNNKEGSRKRLSALHAEQADQVFLSKFIHLKYTSPKYRGKKCSPVVKMSMRDDKFEICSEEKDKAQLAETMLTELQQFFK